MKTTIAIISSIFVYIFLIIFLKNYDIALPLSAIIFVLIIKAYSAKSLLIYGLLIGIAEILLSILNFERFETILYSQSGNNLLVALLVLLQRALITGFLALIIVVLTCWLKGKLFKTQNQNTGLLKSKTTYVFFFFILSFIILKVIDFSFYYVNRSAAGGIIKNLSEERARIRNISFEDINSAKEYPNKVFYLYLEARGYNKLPKEILNFKNLESLDLSGNKLTEFPSELVYSSNLRKIALGYNKINYITPEIGKLSKLEYIELKNNNISELPPEIGQLTKLKYLGVSFNKLRELPSEIGNLSKLQDLFLQCNNFNKGYLDQLAKKFPQVNIVYEESKDLCLE